MPDPGVSRVRPMNKCDLERVLAWRNNPAIRRYMYTTRKIAFAEHAEWFEKKSKDPFTHLLIFEIDSISLGFINIQLRTKTVANWGFYAAPEAPKGTGKSLGRAALRYATNEIGLLKIYGEVIAENDRSIRLHLNLGFKLDNIFRAHYFDGQNYHDVLSFILLTTTWKD